MKAKQFQRMSCVWRSSVVLATGIILAACSSTDAIKPAQLSTDPAKIQVRQNWSNRIGDVKFSLQPGVSGQYIALASSDGTVAMLDQATGRDVWRAKLPDVITAGVGTDGQLAAVVNTANEVLAVQSGAILWRHRLTARSFTPPLVAGGRVFVLAADRTITALDGKSGAKLWTQSKQQNETLVVEKAGAIFAVGDTLVIGLSGKLTGLNPANGSTRWEAPIAFARGGNDIERLVDIVGPVHRVGDSVCARAYQSTVGCIDARQGQVVWSTPSKGLAGVAGDEQLVFGSESDGRVLAWKRASGEKLWAKETLSHRGVNAPASVGQYVVVGDGMGFVHWFSKTDGGLMGRTQLDASAVIAQWATSNGQVIAISRTGNVASYSAQ
jgi:outer membrane protein assembly factor BamB